MQAQPTPVAGAAAAAVAAPTTTATQPSPSGTHSICLPSLPFASSCSHGQQSRFPAAASFNLCEVIALLLELTATLSLWTGSPSLERVLGLVGEMDAALQQLLPHEVLAPLIDPTLPASTSSAQLESSTTKFLDNAKQIEVRSPGRCYSLSLTDSSRGLP